MEYKESKILHVDGDGFFAACEVARRPDLRGKPVVVGQDRGIACAMTYEAKHLGITRATPIFEIRKKFPEVVILPTHFELYEAYSEKLYRVLCSHLKTVEWYSIDECFAVMPKSMMKRHGSWQAAIQMIKDDVQSQLGITFSFGLADTKVLAKVASKMEKPDGCTVLDEPGREAALQALAIEGVWGIGWKTSEKLRKKGIQSALDFVRRPEEYIQAWFAEPIQVIWHELRGKRISEIHTGHGDKKSLQATRSFSPASDDAQFVWSELSRNVEIACRRLRDQGLVTRSFSVFVKSKSITRRTTGESFNLPFYTQNPSDMLGSVRAVYQDLMRLHPGMRYRATGVSVYGLVRKESLPPDLFGDQEEKFQHDGYLGAVDGIQDKFGHGSISLGSSMKSLARRKLERAGYARTDSYVWNLPLPYLGEVS